MFRKKDHLAIQYIQGRLTAEVIRDRKPNGHWEFPGQILEPEELTNGLKLITEQMDFSGEKVSMIILAPSIDCLTVKVPIMTAEELSKHLAWKANAVKGSSYIWSYTVFNEIDKSLNLNLHLVPEIFRSIFMAFCQSYGLQPIHLLTLAAVAPMLLTKSEGKGDALEMVIAPIYQSTFLIIGNTSSTFIVREIPYSLLSKESETLDRMKREVQRTVLYILQRFGKQVSLIRIKSPGTGLADSIAELVQGADVVVEETDLFWARHAIESSPLRTDNLLQADAIGHNRRRRIMTSVLVVLMLFLAAEVSVGAFLFSISNRVQTTIKSAGFNQEIQELNDKKQAFEKRKGEIASYNALAEAIRLQQSDPAPGWFANFAADALPDGMVLTRLAVSKDSADGWNVEIEGFAPRNPLQSQNLISAFQQRLCSFPCNMRGSAQGDELWLENLKIGSTGESDPKGKKFKITGKLR
jgi:hypothetical protein